MRQNLFLAAFGLALGLACFAGAFAIWKTVQRSLPEGAEFESLEEFQKALVQRDERDVQKDGSLSLRSIILPHPSEHIMYDLEPGLSVRFIREQVTTNSCGMRSPERSIEKPANTYRIALLGDSFAFGWGVQQELIFAQLLEDFLNTAFQGRPRIEVLNFGVPGYSTFQEVALFEERGFEFDPDAVLIYFVNNDFGLPFFIRNIHQEGGVVSAVNFSKRLWSKEDPEVAKQSREINRLLDPNKQLVSLSAALKGRGIPLILALNPTSKWRRQSGKLWALRSDDWIKFVNLSDEFSDLREKRKIPPEAITLGFDPHPSPLGHKLRAELLAAALLPFVDRGKDWLSQE